MIKSSVFLCLFFVLFVCLFVFLILLMLYFLGDTLCWISNGKALLLVLGVPVAFILVFNCAAIFVTLFSIWKAQKVIRQCLEEFMQPIKKIQKNPISFCGPYFRIYFFILSYFFISHTKIKILGKQFFLLSQHLLFPAQFQTISSSCVCSLVCLAKMRHLLRLRNNPDKKERTKRNEHVGKQKDAILAIFSTTLLIGLNIKFCEIFGKQHIYKSLVFQPTSL